MKQLVRTVRFTCNGGYISHEKAGHKKTVKCVAYIELTGTEEEINAKFIDAKWKAGGPGLRDLPAMRSHYHRCDWPHYHPMDGRLLEP